MRSMVTSLNGSTYRDRVTHPKLVLLLLLLLSVRCFVGTDAGNAAIN